MTEREKDLHNLRLRWKGFKGFEIEQLLKQYFKKHVIDSDIGKTQIEETIEVFSTPLGV
jgi:hypothetical protein